MGFDAAYLTLLQEELEDAERRRDLTDPEGLPIVNRQIREITRDIRRYSMKSKDLVLEEVHHGKGNLSRSSDQASGGVSRGGEYYRSPGGQVLRLQSGDAAGGQDLPGEEVGEERPVSPGHAHQFRPVAGGVS